jgi:hypothetical protein
VAPAGGRTGILSVDFSLQHGLKAATQRLGSAELRLGGASATLVFDAP